MPADRLVALDQFYLADESTSPRLHRVAFDAEHLSFWQLLNCFDLVEAYVDK